MIFCILSYFASFVVLSILTVTDFSILLIVSHSGLEATILKYPKSILI